MKAFRRTPQLTGILGAFFLLILLLVGCEKGTLGARGGSINGYVLDSRTLAGLSGVAVTATTGEGDAKESKLTTTDSKGNYALSELRVGEWSLAYDKYGYEAVTVDASASVKVVVVNNENRQAPEVRMRQILQNQYITVRGTLKDSKNGTPIVLGTAQYSFDNITLSNRLPTEIQSGLSFPAMAGPVNFRVFVSNYRPYEVVLNSALSDIDLGVINLDPESYKIVGVWKDVPGWVLTEGPTADVIAYAGNRVVASVSVALSQQTFELTGIPIGVSVTLEAQIRGYRMNGAVPVTPNGDFQGVVYQSLSLKNNFTQILRDVRIMINGTGIGNNERIGAYCNQTGTRWPETIVSGGILSAPRVIDLGTNQVPTGYTLTFSGYNVDDGTVGTTEVIVNDDGTDAQTIFISVS